MSEPGHLSRCDYSMVIVPRDAECYCPAPEESRLPCGHTREEEHLFDCSEWESEG